MCTYIYYAVTSDKNGKLLLDPEVSALFIAHGELMCAYFELFGLLSLLGVCGLGGLFRLSLSIVWFVWYVWIICSNGFVWYVRFVLFAFVLFMNL